MPIEKIKDPVITELEIICKTRLNMPVTFIHANLFEANFGLDELTKDSDVTFPVFVHVANGKSKNTVNEAHEINRKVEVFGMLLNRIDNPTSDYKSEDVNDVIYEMHQLGNNLIYWINRSALSVDGGVDEFEMVDVYQKFDAHLFGQAMTFTWSLSIGKSGY